VLDQLEPGAPSLNIAERWRLEGEISHAELEEAFRVLVARHPGLRTCFAGADGERVQIVEPHVRLHLPLIDLSALPEAEALAEAERIALREARIPSTCPAPPLVRATHLRISERVSLLLVTAHHIVCDPWSIGILARELGGICAALQAKRPPVLPPLSTTYGAFSARQAERRTSAADAQGYALLGAAAGRRLAVRAAGRIARDRPCRPRTAPSPRARSIACSRTRSRKSPAGTAARHTCPDCRSC
jgi:hypothetical protein